MNFALGVVFGSFVIVALFCGRCEILGYCLGFVLCMMGGSVKKGFLYVGQ